MKFRVPVSLRAAIGEAARVASDPLLALWSLFVIFFPCYIFPSGLPQPADCLMVILTPMLFARWNGRLPGEMVGPIKALGLFTLYIVVANIAWSMILLSFTPNPKYGFLMSPTFYIFNAMMFLSFLLMFQRYGERLLWLTARLVLVSVAIQCTLALLASSVGTRSKLMFNNPNQLGYYALLSACLILVGQKRLRLSTLQVTIGLAGCSYLALMSASKAALVSIGALGIALLISRLRTIVIASIVFGALILTSNPFSAAIERAERRIVDDESAGLLEERGYDRVIQYPEYWVLGSGEGAYQRFAATTVIGAHELHSSGATLLFCYGFLGMSLFGVFLWRVMRGTGLRIWLVVAPAFAYGMAHQGLRFRLLWLLLGMAVTLKHLARHDRGKVAT